MQGKLPHLSDQQLLQFIDRELPSQRLTQIRAHLGDCSVCCDRLGQLEAASNVFYDFHQNETESIGSSGLAGHARLKKRLAESFRGTAPSTTMSNSTHNFRTAGWSAAACLLILPLMMVGSRGGSKAANESASLDAQATALPMRTITPGAKRVVALSELCEGDLDNDPPVEPALEEAVFTEYGLSHASASSGAYRLDYLISPALGGDDDLRNLWPQPSSSTEWNAQKKDQLESHLHEMVCSGSLPLATAQNAISTDWIAAYRRYVSIDNS